MSKRRALGRGLEALLPAQGELPADAVQSLPVERIVPNPLQPRAHFNTERMAELVASIRENGVLQPIVVRPAGDSRWELIVGERRWRACQKAGMARLPAIVQSVSDEKMLELAVVENVQRDDLNPIEEARAYQLLMERFGLTQEAVAGKVSRSRPAVANALRLLKLPRGLQEFVMDGRLTMGHARALLPLPAHHQVDLAYRVVKGTMTVRQLEAAARRICMRTPEREKTSRQDPNLSAAVSRLEDRWRTRVEIRTKGKGGQIVLHFSDTEQLDRIYSELLGAE